MDTMSNWNLLAVAFSVTLATTGISAGAVAQDPPAESTEESSESDDDRQRDDEQDDTTDEASEPAASERSETTDSEPAIEESDSSIGEDEDSEDGEEDNTRVPSQGPTSASESASREADEDLAGPESEQSDGESDDETTRAEEPAAGSDPDEPSIYIESNAESDESPEWRIGIGGYLRTKFRHIENDPDVGFVGRYDGFILSDARLSLHGSMKNGLGFMFEFDGAVGRNDTDSNSPIVPVRMHLKDTFAYYQPFDQLRLSVGQFKPPYDVEELTSNSALLFADESVASRGVQNVEGYNVDGLSLTREVGARLDGEPYYPLAEGDEATGPGASYALAVTNGQEANTNLNDNDRLAYYGRGALHWGQYVRVGGAYFVNDETRGERPDRVDVEIRGWTADLTVTAFGVTAIGSIMEQTETPLLGDSADEQDLTARGYQGQIAYEEPFIGLQPAYRYAYYDPSADYGGEVGGPESFFNRDARTHHTIGLNYNAKSYPVRVMLDYTFTEEQEGRELENNRFDALLQLDW